MKLVVAEPETNALRAFLRTDRDRCASALVEIEVVRAVRRAAPAQAAAAHQLISDLIIVDLDDSIRGRAAALDPPALRSLDAVHLATALAVGELDAFVTYDTRLAEAAQTHGLRTVAPA